MENNETALKLWYEIYLAHKEGISLVREIIVKLGGIDPEIEAIEKGDSYPYMNNIKDKIKFILLRAKGQRMSSYEIGEQIRNYEPKMNQSSVNQYCSILGRSFEINTERKGNKNKYYIE